MIHELTHMVHWEHDKKFDAFMETLRGEYDDLRARGYTGEGFLSTGRKLGGSKVSTEERRRRERKAGEERGERTAEKGRRLGGEPSPRGHSTEKGRRLGGKKTLHPSEGEVRKARVKAIERQREREGTVLRGCEGGVKDTKKTKEGAEEAIKKGVRTKVEREEEEANDEAIARALEELEREDEMVLKGALDPGPGEVEALSGGLSPASGSELSEEVLRGHTQPKRPISRLVAEAEARKAKTSPQAPIQPSSGSGSSAKAHTLHWSCPACTLSNEITDLYCVVCDEERPLEVDLSIIEAV